MSFRMVVDSPPGMISASTCSRSAAVRTSGASAPQASRARRCSAKSPCSARTPGRTRPPSKLRTPSPLLPPAGGQPLLRGDLPEIHAAHGLAEAPRHLGQHLGIPEVGGGLNDRPCPLRRLLALEDARPDDDPLGTELHDERGSGR